MQLLLIAAALSAGADAEPDTLPKGPPPSVAVIAATDMHVTHVSYRAVPVIIEEKVAVVVGGKAEERTVRRMLTQMVPFTVRHALKDVKATTAGGKKLDADAV